MRSTLLVRFFSALGALFALSFLSAHYYLTKDNIHTSGTSVCRYIADLKTENDLITLNLKKNLKNKKKIDFTKDFMFKTSWKNESIFYPPGSAEFVSLSTNKLVIRYYLPVVDTYKGEFQCSLFKQNITLAIKEFSTSNERSQLFCHGESYLDRWCDARNILVMDSYFFFSSPAQFIFPRPFMIPGARTYPDDRPEDRLAIEPIVIQESLTHIPVPSVSIVEAHSLLVGPFYNNHMLWHFLFDLAVPTYTHLNKNIKVGTRDERLILLKSSNVWQMAPIMKCMTSRPLIFLEDSIKPTIFRKLAMGIEKSKHITNEDGDVVDYVLENDPNNSFRDCVITSLGIQPGNSSKPLVLFISREGSLRDIQNLDQIVEIANKTCPECEVRVVRFEKMTFEEQIETASKAQILIGIHGSGLGHLIWMQKSTENRRTHVVEVFPYGYDCRMWYRTASNFAGIEYHGLWNKNPPVLTQPYSPNLPMCIEKQYPCISPFCHDILRDQPVHLELEVFNETWSKILPTLKTINN